MRTDEEFEVVDDLLDGDGEAVPDEVAAELAAVAAAEDEAAALESADRERLQAVLTSTEQELARQRERTLAAVARYREAVLASEPDLPPELVRGETLEELDSSLASAREAVAQIRQRLVDASAPRGFPVGAPARGAHRAGGMSAAEKIAYGLQQRVA
ncbi:MAG: hypothetical protein GEU80_05075 [Dehalococcoidia bacterium]|nr:hypothetical protein [Dehalococcoidia bacterium]